MTAGSASDGTRFSFGENWRKYLSELDDTLIAEAIRGMKDLLGVRDLAGRTFLDIGSGSGVHSLAAHRMGAELVVSFDYDEASVACTLALKEREGNPRNWEVCQGSVLDEDFMLTLPRADIVYSWGVLHHTGEMWRAIRIAADRCAGEDSLYCIGIYNRKAILSPCIKRVKAAYVRSGRAGKFVIKWSYWLVCVLYGLLRGQWIASQIRDYHKKRGMNYWRDLEDWVGGYPFECATVAEVVSYVLPLGFELARLKANSSFMGVSQFVFRRTAVDPERG